MDESVKDDATDGSRFVGRIGFRRSRSGTRLWPTELKGRIVRESLAPGARVADVARKYGLCAQQLTEWRRAARWGVSRSWPMIPPSSWRSSSMNPPLEAKPT